MVISEKRHWDSFYTDGAYRPEGVTHWLLKILLDFLRRIAPIAHYSVARRYVSRGRFVEVGCGRARSSIMLTRMRPGTRFVGVDISTAAVLEAQKYARKKRARADFVLADGRWLPFRDEMFTFSWSAGVLEHIDDLAGFAREAHRVLRPGGNLVIILPTQQNLLVRLRDGLARVTGSPFSFERYWGEAHVTEHRPKAIEDALRTAGMGTSQIHRLARELDVEYAIVSPRPNEAGSDGRPSSEGGSEEL